VRFEAAGSVKISVEDCGPGVDFILSLRCGIIRLFFQQKDYLLTICDSCLMKGFNSTPINSRPEGEVGLVCSSPKVPFFIISPQTSASFLPITPFWLEGILKLHDGTISATSLGLGKGSTFNIELPVVRVVEVPLQVELTVHEPGFLASASEQVEGSVSITNVMVVDDAPTNRKMLSRYQVNISIRHVLFRSTVHCLTGYYPKLAALASKLLTAFSAWR